MKMKLIERRREAPGVESFVFAPEESLTWKAGQYAQYVLDHETADDRGSQRWFTISSAPYDRHVMLTTRFNDALSSTFKSRLKDFNVGDEIEVAGAEGDFTLDDTEGEYVFLAGGIGVTPFHSMVRQFAHEGAMPRITLLHANSDAYAPFKDQLDTIASRYARFQVKYLAPGERLSEESIRAHVPHLEQPTYYIAGPDAMVEDLKALLERMGVQSDRIKHDGFPGYSAE